MNFNKDRDKIAVSIPYIRMRNSADGIIDNWNEVLVATFAIDETGISNALPALNFNLHTFNVRSWTTFNLLGEGRLIYGPKNPGSFLAYSVLFIEDDQDVRETGHLITQIVNSDDVKGILKSIPMNPTVSLVTSVTSIIVNMIGNAMKSNKNDEIMRIEGSLLRDKMTEPPYNINTEFTTENKYLNVRIRVTPLVENANSTNKPPEIIQP